MRLDVRSRRLSVALWTGVGSSADADSLGWCTTSCGRCSPTPLIRRTVGSESFRRGAVYADQGRVSDVAYSQRHGSLYATVRGSGAASTRRVAEFDDNEVRWWGECSCPVGMDCKHVAALLLTTQRALNGAARATRSPAPARPSWERALGDLVGSGSTRPGTKGTPLGLAVRGGGCSPRALGDAGRAGTAAPGGARSEGPLDPHRGVVAHPRVRLPRGPRCRAGRRAACPAPPPRGRAGPLRLLRRRRRAGPAGGLRSGAVARTAGGGRRRRDAGDHGRRTGPADRRTGNRGRRRAGGRGRRPAGRGRRRRRRRARCRRRRSACSARRRTGRCCCPAWPACPPVWCRTAACS